jgi:hypothetical protein
VKTIVDTGSVITPSLTTCSYAANYQFNSLWK